METIKLKYMQEVYSGIDKLGDWWVQFEARQEPFQCCICGDTLKSGWLCPQNGSVACDHHIERE